MMANYKVDSINKYKGRDTRNAFSDLRNWWTNSKSAYFVKQRLCGAAMFMIGIMCPIVLDGDATFSLFAILTSVGLLITNKRVMTF